MGTVLAGWTGVEGLFLIVAGLATGSVLVALAAVLRGLSDTARNTRALARAQGVPDDHLGPGPSRGTATAIDVAACILKGVCGLMGAAMLST